MMYQEASIYYLRKTFRTDCTFWPNMGTVIQCGFREFCGVLWSYDSRFELCSDTPERCLHRSGERFNPECISTAVKHGGGGIMVWGAFSSAGVGELMRCEQSITAKEYQNILEKGLLPSLQKLFSGDKS